PRPRPWYLLDTHAAVPAPNSSHARAHEGRHLPGIEVPPLPGRLDVVDALLGLAAPRANRRCTRRLEVHDQAVLAARRVHNAPALGNTQLPGQDAQEHPSDSSVVSQAAGEAGGMLFVSCPIGEATGTRRSCSQPRAEARSRGAAGAERSELALDGDASSVASRRDRGACDHAAATVTRKREHPYFQRVYTSMYDPGPSAPAYRKPLGDRWQHNWMSWLDDSGNTLVIH